MEAPYMIITFDSTPLGREKFKAAMHQYDFTLRPQIVDKDWNPGYWKLLSNFEKLTGIGGVLNTSFNLHGYPIVASPEDALHVFVNSGLKYLAIGSYVVSKH
jgi:carbamoyltransferase